jgi:hypothetical protein
VYAGRFTFAFVYTREAHPGERVGHHRSLDEKMQCAATMIERHHITRPMLVDDLEGTVHRAYGLLPNMTYILSSAGTVLYRANWTDARSIARALEQLDYERDQQAQGSRLAPFYAEVWPQRVNEHAPFMEGLLEAGGRRAVEEFIAAITHTRGEAMGRSLAAWWASRR